MLSIFLTEELEKIIAQSQDANLAISFATTGTRSVTLLSLTLTLNSIGISWFVRYLDSDFCIDYP